MTTRTPFIGGNWKMNGDLATLSDLTLNIKAKLTDKSKAEIVCISKFCLSVSHKKITG